MIFQIQNFSVPFIVIVGFFYLQTARKFLVFKKPTSPVLFLRKPANVFLVFVVAALALKLMEGASVSIEIE